MTRTSVGYPANPLQEGYHALRLATGSLDQAVYSWRLAVRGEIDAGRLEAAAAAALAEVQALHDWPDLQPQPDPPGLSGRPAVAAVRAVPGGADVDLTVHHLAADGAAIGALCELIGARYRDPGVRGVVSTAALTGALDGLVRDRAEADLAYWAAQWTRVGRPAAQAEPRPPGYHVASVAVNGERLRQTIRGRRTPLTGLLIGAAADAVEYLLGTPLPALMVSIDLRPHLPFPPTDARAIGFAINSVVVPAVHLRDGAGLRDAVAGLLDHGLTPMPVLTARYAREHGRAAPAAPWLIQVVSEPVPTLVLPGGTSTSVLSGTAAYGRAGLVTLVVGERPRIELAVAGTEPGAADRLAAMVAELVQGADEPSAVAGTAATGALPPARPTSEPEAAPADPAVAEAVRDAWRAVLHLTVLPPDAHFLALGGTSVAAVALSHRLATGSGLELSPDHALSNPRLVDHIRFVRPRQSRPESPAAPSASMTVPVPMPAVMYRYMKHDRDGVFNTEYNLNYAWRIEGPVDAGALAAAAEACTLRHEALRLRYFRDGGEWRVYAAEVDDPLQITRVAAAAYEDDETVQALVGAEQAKPFEPHRPLIRMALWSEPAGRRHLFSITVPHMVFDGWSKNILLADLVAFYAEGPGARRPEVHGWWEYRADQLAGSTPDWTPSGTGPGSCAMPARCSTSTRAPAPRCSADCRRPLSAPSSAPATSVGARGRLPPASPRSWPR